MYLRIAKSLRAIVITSLLSTVGAAGLPGCDDEETPPDTTFIAGKYRGSYSGAESGTTECTIDNKGNLTATGNSPSAGAFMGSGKVDGSGSASFAAGAGTAGQFSVTFSGKFTSTSGVRAGQGTWTSSSGFTGTWSVTGMD